MPLSGSRPGTSFRDKTHFQLKRQQRYARRTYCIQDGRQGDSAMECLTAGGCRIDPHGETAPREISRIDSALISQTTHSGDLRRPQAVNPALAHVYVHL